MLPYHLATMAPLLGGLLDQLGCQQADVLGISWGGRLAQQFALHCPDRVRRLVLVATAPGALMVPGHPRVLLRMLIPRRHRDPGYAARIAGQLYGGRPREDPRWPATCCTPPQARAPAAATTTSSPPASPGPAYRGCRG